MEARLLLAQGVLQVVRLRLLRLIGCEARRVGGRRAEPQRRGGGQQAPTTGVGGELVLLVLGLLLSVLIGGQRGRLLQLAAAGASGPIGLLLRLRLRLLRLLLRAVVVAGFALLAVVAAEKGYYRCRCRRTVAPRRRARQMGRKLVVLVARKQVVVVVSMVVGRQVVVEGGVKVPVAAGMAIDTGTVGVE